MTQSQDPDRTWAESLESAARYFTHTEGGAFRFAVTSDELVQRRFNAELQQVLRGKGVPVRIHDWSKASPPDMYPAEQLRRLKAAHPETKGIICIGLERAMRENPEMLTMLNFAREALLEVGVPLFFWISFRTLPLMSRFAIDLYNQRIGANLYFEHDAESTDADGSAMRFIAHETVHANRDLRPLEARLKLLEKQFDELKQIQSPEKLANDIVLELLKVYIEIPGMSRMVRSLIDEYGGLVDLKMPDNCFTLGEAYRYIGEFQTAEEYYGQALNDYRLLAEQNPQAWLPNVAKTLNNLAVRLSSRTAYVEAEKNYQEALTVYRDLARINPNIYLSDVAMMLNNLAILQRNRNKYSEAEQSFEEALSLYRDLARINPNIYLSDVAMTLNNLAMLQRDRNKYSEAEKNSIEALSLYRDLARINPNIYLPDIAMTLNNIACIQSDLKEYVAAEKNYKESLSIRRELANLNPQLYLSEIAASLINLGVLYQEYQSDRQKSLSCIQEALLILKSLNESVQQNEIFISALKVLVNWGLDPDEFIANLNIPQSGNPANDTSSAPSQNQSTEKS